MEEGRKNEGGKEIWRKGGRGEGRNNGGRKGGTE